MIDCDISPPIFEKGPIVTPPAICVCGFIIEFFDINIGPSR